MPILPVATPRENDLVRATSAGCPHQVVLAATPGGAPTPAGQATAQVAVGLVVLPFL